MMAVIALPPVVCNPFHENMMNPDYTLKLAKENIDT